MPPPSAAEAGMSSSRGSWVMLPSVFSSGEPQMSADASSGSEADRREHDSHRPGEGERHAKAPRAA